ncbi:MAG: precorrin-4 C(11)-methyltransferase [bacterium]|nr:precorrin-4 C(11)-methyltransferase [bacterium]
MRKFHILQPSLLRKKIQGEKTVNKVYFVGAGPGDPDLITVKGKKFIESADIIIYAGSLVNKEVIACRKKESLVYNSASMTLDEVLEIIKKGISENLTIARVHTGDPSLYGAIREQIVELEKSSIDYEIIPGVSSFTAAASVLGKEFTLPGVSQTVICTRLEGRTPVPEKESLELLASHQASMSIFLSVHMIDDVVEKLTKHYPLTTPVAIIQKATWEDQKIISGTLEDISLKVKEEEINKTAMILVGEFLGNDFEKSKLYDKHFSHEFRQAQ